MTQKGKTPQFCIPWDLGCSEQQLFCTRHTLWYRKQATGKPRLQNDNFSVKSTQGMSSPLIFKSSLPLLPKLLGETHKCKIKATASPQNILLS